MSTESFQKDSLSWRFDLYFRRLNEWMEFRISQMEVDLNLDFSWLKSELLWQIIRFLLWTLIIILLVWITWQLWLLLRPYRQQWSQQPELRENKERSPQRASAAEWIRRSQLAEVEGNYRQGIFCLYQGMLQLLEERKIMAQQTSRTDEEYRRSLATVHIFPAQSYELLLSIHQRLCFSSAEASASLFKQCQQAYLQLENS